PDSPHQLLHSLPTRRSSDLEIQLTDAIQNLNQIQRVFGYEFEGQRYDVGEKLGFIETTIEFALQKEELRDELLKFMAQKLDTQSDRKSTRLNSSHVAISYAV